MRVLHICYADARGGAPIAAWRIHQAVLKAGVDSRMLCMECHRGDSLVLPMAKRPGIALNMLKNSALNSVLKVIGLNRGCSLNVLPSGLHRLINKMDVDIVNLHWVNLEIISIKEIAKLSKPVVWTLHDLWPILGSEHYPEDEDAQYITGYTWEKNKISTWCWKRKVKHWRNFKPSVVCVGSWLSACVEKSFLFKNMYRRVIPNTLNLEVFKPIDPVIARNLLNIPQNKKIILFGAIDGSKDPRKGFDLLERSLRLLGSEVGRESVVLYVFGQHKPKIDLDFGLDIHFCGRVFDEEKAMLLYNAADVMCVPSRMETFGQTALEAIACGTPVVAFNTTGLRDIIDHQENGYLARAFDPQDFCKGIEWVLSKCEKSERDGPQANEGGSGSAAVTYAQLCVNARSKAESCFSEAVVGTKYVSMYEKVLGSKGN